jgi:hypothetical protein
MARISYDDQTAAAYHAVREVRRVLHPGAPVLR